MFLRIETSSFLQRSSFWCNLKILNSHIGSDSLKGVNQGVPPLENVFLIVLSMFLRIETLSFFAKVLILVQLEDIKITHRVRPPEGGKSGGTTP